MNSAPSGESPPPDADLLSDAQASVLEALAAQGETLFVQLGRDAPQFRSRVRSVDSDRRFILLEPSADESANAALMRLNRVTLLAEWGEWRIEFIAEAPETVAHGEARAIRLDFPLDFTVNRRRMLPRASVPQQIPLTCTVRDESGTLWFSAPIMDISQGGLCMLDDSPEAAPLEPGATLRGYQVERPDHAPVSVELEVRYTEDLRLEDGSRARRIGCRFIGISPEIVLLVAEFFTDKN